jgi:hypothetical protein
MTTDQKPGCIHPGDPEGCIGTFMTILAIVVLAVAAAIAWALI